MKTVALLGAYAPSLVNFRGSMIAAIASRGHRVIAMAPNISEELAQQLKGLGAEPVSVTISRSGLNPFGDWATYSRLKAVFAEYKPDVVIPYTIKPVIWGTLAAHAAGVPTVMPIITGLGFAFTGGNEPRRVISRIIASSLYAIALGKASKVLFQNPDDRDEFSRLKLLDQAVPVDIINGSGIDIRHFRQTSLPDGPSFLMIARLLGDKGIREFAEAASVIKSKYPDVVIGLVGYLDESPDSITQKELEQIKASGVRFLGKLEDVRPAIAGASVYVLPSYREGTPRSVLEAMAMGRAIITTDAPGCRETVIHGENGYLVPPRDTSALCTAMINLIENPQLIAPMGQRSREIAERKYDVKKVNAAIIKHAGLEEVEG